MAQPEDSIHYHLAQAKQYRLENMKLSEQHARQALKLAHATGTDTLILDAKQSLGICFLVQQRNEEAIELFKKIAVAAANTGDLYHE